MSKLNPCRPDCPDRAAPSLYQAVKAADDENRAAATKQLPRYEYPDHIVTAAMVQRWCKYGVDYRLSVQDSRPIDALDAQRARGFPFSETASCSAHELRRRELRRRELRRRSGP